MKASLSGVVALTSAEPCRREQGFYGREQVREHGGGAGRSTGASEPYGARRGRQTGIDIGLAVADHHRAVKAHLWEVAPGLKQQTG
jgi:hypothetical protein